MWIEQTVVWRQRCVMSASVCSEPQERCMFSQQTALLIAFISEHILSHLSTLQAVFFSKTEIKIKMSQSNVPKCS